MVFWFIGMSGSGKTTIGSMLEDYLEANKIKCYRIDGDEIRNLFDNDLGYSVPEREQNMKRIVSGAYLLSKNDIITIVCAAMPFEKWREFAHTKVNDSHEFYMKRSIESLIKNDVKGVYARNMGKSGIVGIDIAWETPLHSNLILDTDVETVEESFQKVKSYVDPILRKSGLINK